MSGVLVIDRPTATALIAGSLGVPFRAGDTIGRAFIAQSLRRAVFIAAPCTHRAVWDLAAAVLEPLADDPAALKDQIDQALEDLIAMGDLLEMREEPERETACLLRPAPPAFVRRRDGRLAILGVAGDEITPSLQGHIVHHASGLRTIDPEDADGCRALLMDLGVIELPERIWLHAPPAASASDHVKSWMAKLPGEAAPVRLDGVDVLDAGSPVTYYKGRWAALNSKHTGLFIARRPQKFGAKLWALAEVRGGVVQRLVDIHPRDSRFRACDEAWRLQAAFDAEAGHPQQVAVAIAGSIATLSFFSPLPAWAERRLCIVGKRIEFHGALFAFELPAASADAEVKWLADALWFTRAERGTP
ncbi:MAG: hypothetical protein ABL957_06355 [Parvularculaceae bacterium]